MSASPRLTITQVDPKGPSVTMLLGDGFPTPTADGGWESVARPRESGFIEWIGTQPISMDVPVVMDGFRDDSSIEASLAILESMCRKRQGVRAEPPVVRLVGAVRHSNLHWVIQNIAYADVVRRAADAAITRQAMTISLLEYVTPDIVTAKSAAKRKQSGGSHRTYVVRRGDTLPKIAARELHSAKRWREIATLNKLRDPNHLKVGTRLRLP